MPVLPCKEYREWVEEEVQKPIEERIKKTRQACKKRKCKKLCLCCNKWFCWLEVFFLTVVKWIVIIVLRELVYWVCEVVDWFIENLWNLWMWLVCGIMRFFFGLFGRGGNGGRIERVFVLMLENRSFDHMLGFADLRGRDAENGQPTVAEGLPQKDAFNLSNPSDPGSRVDPSHPADYKVSDEDRDPGHEFDDVLEQIAGVGAHYPNATGHYPPPNMRGFIANYRAVGSAHPENIMRCYRPQQLPVLVALAREFAVCDRWFSSMPGPTWPNRFFIHAATSGSLDDSPSRFATPTSPLVGGFAFANGTIFDTLESHCREWKIFHGDAFPQVFAISGMLTEQWLDRTDDLDEFREQVSDPDYSAAYTFIEPDYGNILPTTPGDFTCGNSQHPLDDVTRGERLIKDVYEAIRNSPHWESSLLVITWDEHGGFYDHVSPPRAVPPGDTPIPTANVHGFDFSQYGVRVPTVVVSPYIPRGTIDHRLYDHASVPATLERLFSLNPLTARDAAAKDVLPLLSLAVPRTDAPTTLPEPAWSGYECV